MSRVRRAPIPGGPPYPGGLDRVDYGDAVVGPLPSGTAHTPEWVARGLLSVRPVWVRILLGLRDLLVAPFGLRHGGAPRPGRTDDPVKPGERLSFYTVVSRKPDELVLAADDRHLQSRLVVSLSGDEVRVSTLVRFNNLGGRFYFFFAKPFQRIMLRSLLARALDGRS